MVSRRGAARRSCGRADPACQLGSRLHAGSAQGDRVNYPRLPDEKSGRPARRAAGAEDKMKGDAKDKAAQALSTRRREIFEDPDTPVAGNPNGDVSLVEFFDYRCPYCKQVEPSLEALLGEDRQLRLVYKEFPVLGPESVTASKAALAARKQGKYDAFHRAMMTLKGQINETAVYKTAESVGVDVDRLKRDMAAPEIARALKANTELADALDIRGTPGFIVGNEIVPGAIDLASLKQLIATARKK